jgi:hypothetical protein
VKIHKVIDTIRDMCSLPELVVRLNGDEEGRKSFDIFTRPHPKYKTIQNKRWGVAMIKLPNTFEEYLQGSQKKQVRLKRNRVKSSGYQFRSLSPLEYLEDMMAINASMEVRQGKPIRPDYLDREAVQMFFKDVASIYGVFDERGNLRAYAHTPIRGEVFLFSRLLGHADHLKKGVMYYLISEVIREMIERKARHGTPLWAMYDTFFGASEGLRYFKERLGFKPYKVRWELKDAP